MHTFVSRPRHLAAAALAGVAVALGLAASPAAAAEQPPRTAELQRNLDRVVAAGVPGAIALVRDGDRAVRLTSGLGDVRARTPIRATDRFRVGSLTKTYVGAVVLQLAGEGKLSLDDTVERWLPGVVPNGQGITVRQLLNMSSGLFDYLDDRNTTILDRFLAGDWTYRYAPLELVGIATAHAPDFPPGQGYSYCNTCYVLAGLIVERATGNPIATELSRRILERLRLRDTHFDTEPRIAGRHSHGYLRMDGRLLDVSDLSPSWAWAAGAITSTAADVERFYSALNRGRVLSPALMREMRTTVASAPGQGYGLGLARVDLPCGSRWGNGGDFLGYNAEAWGSERGRRTAVFFVNLDELSQTPRIRRAINRLRVAAVCGGAAR
jgi:D-alanyl-D-alanine carboxypeptidase